ncbi:MAG: Homogentisate 1,2-dioxygenase [Ktedonobacterales bacterium]|jgi:homogentisate 1,2-dioxygenase|nr:MAG: Homogentisate 1,2-dioxygenase [Ktedonobacterales bacterium]
MPFYSRLGNVPHKRHTQFRKPDGGLYAEELFGEEGFSGVCSLLYHQYPPTRVSRIERHSAVCREEWSQETHRHHHVRTKDIASGGDPIEGRELLFYNSDCAMSVVRPTEQMEYFYRNSQGDELLFIHEGKGALETTFGLLPYGEGDYLVIPRGTTWRVIPEGDTPQRMLVVEAFGGAIQPPKRYRNEFGQLLEHSPYCERDLRAPLELPLHEERGEFEVRVKVNDEVMRYFFDFHPLDVVGWDGYLYPYAFNISDFEPITGRVHQPPPVHQTFEGPNFVVCSFCPRKLDYHPLSIPVPYNHSNIDSDELIYYVSGNFGSRRGIDVSSFTLHPRGIPHGPHPGTVEKSLGADRTDELAVMVDTFRPLKLAAAAESLDDANYPYSWLD